MARELKTYQLIERSIIKKYRKELWNPFIEATKNYHLVCKNDVINVTVANDKRSILLAKLMQQLKRVSDVEFELEFMDISGENVCEYYNIPCVEHFSKEGKKAGLITFTDVVQKALKSILFDGSAEGYLPANSNTINPLFCIKNEAINSWVKYNNLPFSTVDESDKIEFEELTPEVEHSIFKSVHAVCLNTIPAYIQNDIKHSYLEKY